jgi:TPR repeat protein
LVAEGEKYLYGKGVPQNCDQARTNLFVAAGQSNAEAQAALGTMFATGHCVARDLPAAFRWFARAERKQPNNPRIEGDLRLLWKEMTSEEQNAAARSLR